MPAQQGMVTFVGQQFPAPANAQMMQQPAQQAMPMMVMAPYYAPTQQPYYAPNQQQQQRYF
jgi:hypothetical protein